MSTETQLPPESEALSTYEYRELAPLSVISLICGLLSVPLVAMATVLPPFLFALLPILGVIVGLRSWLAIRRQPTELTGMGLAKAGTFLSLGALLSGYAYSGFVYATEVPEGYQRIGYQQLQSDDPDQLVPPTARELDGKSVFIKGYMYPGPYKFGIKQFVLCRDNGDCCFGGQPKLTDMIQVTLKPGQSIAYTTAQSKVVGKLRVHPAAALHDLGAVLYHLDDAEYLE